jgi:hypothetical protein
MLIKKNKYSSKRTVIYTYSGYKKHIPYTLEDFQDVINKLKNSYILDDIDI